MTDLYWDPFSPELRDDPYPLWKRMRDEEPVYHNDKYDFWVLSRFHDIEHAHKDVETYSSSHGTTLDLMSEEPMDTGMFINLDPPKHTVLRRLVSRAFTTRRMSMLEERIREVCAGLLDPHVGAGGFDYVQDFSAILPPTIISSLLGVPEQDQQALRHLVDDMFVIDESGLGLTGEVAQKAMLQLFEYLGSQFAERRNHPRDDMFTELVQAEITDETGDLRHMTDDELTGFGLVLFAAGSETVARHLGWVASALPQYPDQRAELARDFSLIPNAIEEILRFEPPSPVQARWVAKEVNLHGATIPVGSKAVLLTGSAARDERKYPQPDVLDIHRRVDLHLTFGYGIHFCLGAALARMEGRIGLEETLIRWPEWQVDREQSVLLYTSTVRGPTKLPVFC
ncbi:MAG TPA: cytochrome P450 [Acidimicrobiales bacterium]|jgi:cytochrome P450|nr:cytochrome P450 [Acidimicrobiales bacterium]